VGRRRERFRQILEDARAHRGAALMGICNVTPDSFSDGGRYFSLEDARARVRALLDEGADVIDIGGESTRPGAPAVPAAEQLARVMGVVSFAVGLGACVSIDTASPEVAAACLDAGACAVNDVSCLREENLASVCVSHGAALVLMHSREPMSELRGFSAYPDDAYGDVVEDVIAEWTRAAERSLAAGLPREALVMDPGLGFAKNARQSLALLAATGTIARRVGVFVCVGASRKSFLALGEKGLSPEDRIGASISAALFAARSGAAMLRVHDVRATRQAIDLERRLVTVPRNASDAARIEKEAR
jgi:dihydropteroate synthase